MKNSIGANVNVRSCEDLGCFFKVEDGVLLWVAMDLNGCMSGEEWGEVTSIESPSDLEIINPLLGTDFIMSDFDGR